MANIVELRGMSSDKLREMLENDREEMFNLRFQKAFAQLDNTARIKIVRQEIAQHESVLNMRQLAIDTAAAEPAIAAALAGQKWQGKANYDYEESGWQVSFSDEKGGGLASALVNLNKKRPRSRAERERKGQPQLVVSYEIAK